jgi:recombination protein RecT
MSNQNSIQLRVKQLFQNADFNQKLIDTLTPQKRELFKTSLLSIVSSSAAWEKVNPISIISTALTSATLDLSLNKNLGYAYIIPYKAEAQFQMGYKGFIQLAQRTGQYKIISASKVCEGQLVKNDPIKGLEFDWSIESDKVIGYVAYFQLLNGFESYLYMTTNQLEKHAGRYSQSYKSNSSTMNIWKDNFEAMATKTVLKLLLSKYGIMSVEMQKAIEIDQASIKDESIDYVDNQKTEIVETKDYILEFIQNEVKDYDKLMEIADDLENDEQRKAFELKKAELEPKEIAQVEMQVIANEDPFLTFK